MMLLDKIKRILEYAEKEHQILCSDIAVMIDDEIVCRYMTGTRDDDKTIPIKGDELYFLYSASKPITCTAALQLYEKGKLSLDDYVYKYIPEFKNVTVRTDSAIKPVKNHITIKHLFTMTSGINYDLCSRGITEQLAKDSESSTLDIVKAIASEPLAFEPGDGWLYGLSHDVLAAVVEIISDMPFAEYLQKNIFDVCGMENTYMYYDDKIQSRMCSQYCYKDEKVILTDKENQYIFTHNYHSGGAGIISCVDDYMKYIYTMINTEKLLKHETLDLMRKAHLDKKQCEIFQECKRGYSYGLGVRTNSFSNFSAKGEFGWDGAGGAYILMDPDNRIGIFYATHIRDYGDYLYNDLHLQLRDTVYEYIKSKS